MIIHDLAGSVAHFYSAEKGWDDELVTRQRIEFLRWTQFTCRAHLALRIMCMRSMLAMVDERSKRFEPEHWPRHSLSYADFSVTA